jgi:hypothetical protein
MLDSSCYDPRPVLSLRAQTRSFSTGRWHPPLLLFIVGATTIVLVACGEGEGARASGILDAPQVPEDLFVDVAARAGIDFVHRNGAAGEFYYPELAHAGAAFLDIDNDGWLDVYLVQSGPLPRRPTTDLNANRLYRNLGDGTFEDVTASAGVDDRGYGIGAAVADFDRDGWVDLYITNLGANALYRNNGVGADGRVTLTNVTESAGVGGSDYSSSAAFVDIDRDGDLDLYVCNYLQWSPRLETRCLGFNGLRGYCSPGEYRPQPDSLYRNDGVGPDGRVTFTDVSVEAGMRSVAASGLGVVTADFDGDGWVDIYVANDQMPNHLWINGQDGTFREEALIRGAALNDLGLPEAGMGVAVEDWDDDGDWDLFVVHLTGETNTFYRNQGGAFRDITDELGLGMVSRPFTGFGTALFDYDNDGWFDIFIANGKVSPGDDAEFDYSEPNQLFRGRAPGGFVNVSSRAGRAVIQREVTRAAAFGDYDNDGDVDILLANNDGPARLLRNEDDSGNHWLSVQLVGRTGQVDRDAQGSIVTIAAGGRTRRRLVNPAYSYSASNDPRVHFGLGALEGVERLVVQWPDGTTQVLEDVEVDQFLKLEADRDPE